MRKNHHRMAVVLILCLTFLNSYVWSAEYFEQLVSFLRKSYIEQNMFKNVRPMLREGLRALENADDSIMVEESYDPTGTTYRVILEGRSTKITESEVDDLEELAVVLARVMEFIEKYFQGDKKDASDLKYAIANGMTSVLDPHTNVFSPKEYKEFFVHIEGAICGIGAYIGVREGKLRIISPLEGTPAKKAGLKAKDHIVRVDDESTINMTTQEAVSKIRGEEDSPVVLWIKRKGQDKLLKKIIKRKKVTIPSVKAQLLKDKIAYIKVISFAHTTSKSFLTNIIKLKKEAGGKFNGIVLDLRDNPGGLLDQAVALADILLKEGEIVMTAHKEIVSKPLNATNDHFEPECPLVVLVNKGSASGSEILAGALRNNNQAILLGQRTFGKGSVQQPRVLNDGSCLKLTVYEYLIANRMSIQNVGVPPDIALDPAVIEEDGIRVFAKDRSITERLHEKSIISRYARNEKASFRMISYLDLPDEPVDGYDVTESFVKGEFDIEGPQFVAVQLACKLIKLADPNEPLDRIKFLSDHYGEIIKLKEQEFAKVIKQMTEFGIDWKEGVNPQDTKLELSLNYKIVAEPPEENSKKDVDEDEEFYEEDPNPKKKIEITATLKNLGDKPVYRVEGIVETDDIASVFVEREFIFGFVPAGKSITRKVKITIPYFSISREEVVTVAVRSEKKKKLTSKSITVRVPPVEMPRIAATAMLTDSDGKKVKKLTPGRQYNFKVNVKNVGSVEVFQGIVRLKNETDPSKVVDLVRGRESFTRLKPGKSFQTEFSFKIKPGDALDKYKFRLDVFETSSFQGLSRDFDISGKNGKLFKDLSLEPPKVKTKISALLTDRKRVKVDSVIEDDEELQHFMILSVSRDKGHIDSFPDKVFFRACRGKGPKLLSTDVELKPGRNLVSVVATDNQKLKTVRSFLVWRK